MKLVFISFFIATTSVLSAQTSKQTFDVNQGFGGAINLGKHIHLTNNYA